MVPLFDPLHEPFWPEVGISSTDFRPHFDGNLITVFSVVWPEGTSDPTLVMLRERTRDIARWVLENSARCGQSHSTDFGIAGIGSGAVSAGYEEVLYLRRLDAARQCRTCGSALGRVDF